MKALLVALAVLGVAGALLGERRTRAAFTDQVTSPGSALAATTLAAPSLGVPSVSGEGSSASVSLSWTDPDRQDKWDLYRLSGACGTPSSTVATNLSSTSTSNTPGAAGTYCYGIKGKYLNWTSPLSNSRQVIVNSGLNFQTDNTLSSATSPTGDFRVDRSTTGYWSASSVVQASNAADWLVKLVLKSGNPGVATGVNVKIWWQASTNCSTGAVSGQIFAQGSGLTVPVASPDWRGFTLTVPAVTGSVSHTFVSGDRLCLSIQNTGNGSENDTRFYANTIATNSTDGTTGVSRLAGPFTQ